MQMAQLNLSILVHNRKEGTRQSVMDGGRESERRFELLLGDGTQGGTEYEFRVIAVK